MSYMSEQKYDWKRFWVLRDGIFRWTTKGYLANPEGPYGKVLNPEIKPLGVLSDVPCLVLLGDPGIGKSEQLTQIQSLVSSQVANSGAVLHFELRDFQTDFKLCQEIFDHPEFQA